MITLGKRGTLHARRRALRTIRSRDVTAKLFDSLAERYRDRPGGYTRVLKLGHRHGDAAPVSIIELVDREGAVAAAKGAAAKKAPAKKAASDAPAKAASAKAKPAARPAAKPAAGEEARRQAGGRHEGQGAQGVAAQEGLDEVLRLSRDARP